MGEKGIQGYREGDFEAPGQLSAKGHYDSGPLLYLKSFVHLGLGDLGDLY